LNRTKAVRILITLLSIAAFLPLLYGLNSYNWDLKALLTPSYTPPKVDFRMEPEGLRFEQGKLILSIKLTNLGEIEAKIEGLNVTLYSNGIAVATGSLEKPVLSRPNSTEELKISITSFHGIPSKIEAKGETFIRVLGSLVRVPVEIRG